jgi:hypothetical protein
VAHHEVKISCFDLSFFISFHCSFFFTTPGHEIWPGNGEDALERRQSVLQGFGPQPFSGSNERIGVYPSSLLSRDSASPDRTLFKIFGTQGIPHEPNDKNGVHPC